MTGCSSHSFLTLSWIITAWHRSGTPHDCSWKDEQTCKVPCLVKEMSPWRRVTVTRLVKVGVDCVLIITKRSDRQTAQLQAWCGVCVEGRGGERLIGCGSFGGIQKMLFSDGSPAARETLNKPNATMCALSRIYSKMSFITGEKNPPPPRPPLPLHSHHAVLSLLSCLTLGETKEPQERRGERIEEERRGTAGRMRGGTAAQVGSFRNISSS